MIMRRHFSPSFHMVPRNFPVQRTSCLASARFDSLGLGCKLLPHIEVTGPLRANEA